MLIELYLTQSTFLFAGGSRLGRSGMDLGLAPARSEASSEDNLRGDVVEALDELLSELETSIGTNAEPTLDRL